MFDRLCAYTRKHAPRLAAALEGGTLLERSTGHVRLAAPNRFAAQRLSSRSEALAELWSGFFGHALRVEVAVPDSPEETLAAKNEGTRAQRSTALNHPAVARAVQILDGEISEVRALGPEGSG